MLQFIMRPDEASAITNDDLIMLYKSFLYLKAVFIDNKKMEKLK